MTQFNFTTNIEERMPDTGKVFCIDRMTSDYAEQHPFDVDGFIESVYQKYIQMAEDDSFCKKWAKTREELRRLWNAVLSTTNPCGNPSIYPNQNDAQPALMEVWLKAGNYWQKGFRQGDTLPDMVPMCKITRLNDGTWIALFPKDKHLLMTTNFTNNTNTETTEELATDSCVPCGSKRTSLIGTNDTDNIEPARNQPKPQQLDLFAMQTENERLRAEIEQMKQERVQSVAVAQRHTRQPRTPRPSRQRQTSAAAVAIEQPMDEPDATKNVLKFLGVLACITLVLVLLWQTGLIIPLGLIGLVTSGFLK
jgi:hypothetical protein